MERLIEQNLVIWKNQSPHLPIILRGARQVGKTFVIEQFGKNHFEHIMVINFELEPEYKQCFTTLKPQEIIDKINLSTKTPIIPEKTLLFLDEIQECPNAIMALRYFKEQMPNLFISPDDATTKMALTKMITLTKRYTRPYADTPTEDAYAPTDKISLQNAVMEIFNIF